MTRNDYARLAAGLRRAWQAAAPGGERIGVAMAASELAVVLAGDNSRFDRAKFLAAVKVDLPEETRARVAARDGGASDRTVRITCTFTPQAWVNDCAIEVDPEGACTWTMRVPATAIPASNTAASDALRDAIEAPAWIRAWRGPFSVAVARG